MPETTLESSTCLGSFTFVRRTAGLPAQKEVDSQQVLQILRVKFFLGPKVWTAETKDYIRIYKDEINRDLIESRRS